MRNKRDSSCSSRTADTEGASSHTAGQSIDSSLLEAMDLTNPEELFKLKGAIIDEVLLRRLLKQFTQK